MCDLTAERFHNDEAARTFLEGVRWPDGKVCPHCGEIGKAYATKKEGVYRCASKECRKDFSVTVGTLFERSHIPLHKWLLATHLLMSSKKGISAHQLHRILGITYKSAWFMAHRIRESLRPDSVEETGPLGGQNKVVEVDKTHIGGKEKNKHADKRTNKGGGPVGKEPVVTLVKRGGKVRSVHFKEVTAKTLRPVMVSLIDRKSYLMTDEAKVYPAVGDESRAKALRTIRLTSMCEASSGKSLLSVTLASSTSATISAKARSRTRSGLTKPFRASKASR